MDLGFQYTKGDTFRENWYSSALFRFREPVLYGHHKKGGMYRFLWLRAFGPPVVFVLTRSGELLTLTTKVLDQQPEFQETKYDPRGWDGLIDELKGKTIERFGDSLLRSLSPGSLYRPISTSPSCISTTTAPSGINGSGTPKNSSVT